MQSINNRTKRPPILTEIQTDSILRVYPHVRGAWFWSKYSVTPYLGCQYGCEYCFLRDSAYGMNANGPESMGHVDSFSQHIRVITNAMEVLDRELQDAPRDIIVVGDYQPIDAQYQLSRRLLEVCLKHRFPTLTVVKSPGILRDLDFISEISRQSWACIAFSIGFPRSEGYRDIFEPGASTIESRFRAMSRVSSAGIYTGTALIPVLPYITDKDENLESIVRQTHEHGGKFVIAGGLVLSAETKDRFFQWLQGVDSALLAKYEDLYRVGFSPSDNSWARLGRKMKQLCGRYGIKYRINRYIPHGFLAENKILAEQLFLKIYEMELDEVNEAQIEECRKLAWLVDEAPGALQKCIVDQTMGQMTLDEDVMAAMRNVVHQHFQNFQTND